MTKRRNKDEFGLIRRLGIKTTNTGSGVQTHTRLTSSLEPNLDLVPEQTFRRSDIVLGCVLFILMGLSLLGVLCAHSPKEWHWVFRLIGWLMIVTVVIVQLFLWCGGGKKKQE